MSGPWLASPAACTISARSEIMAYVLDEEAEELLRALAHPARREILRRCWSQRAAAGELSAGLDLAPASVSEHLKVLRKIGLVTVTVQGTFRWYRSNRERVTAIGHWLTKFNQEETP